MLGCPSRETRDDPFRWHQIRYAGSAQVLGWGDSFEVRRVHAEAVAAEMVDLKALGDRAFDQLVGSAVRVPLPAGGCAAAVPVLCPVPLPLPARVRIADVDAAPEVASETHAITSTRHNGGTSVAAGTMRGDPSGAHVLPANPANRGYNRLGLVMRGECGVPNSNLGAPMMVTRKPVGVAQ